MLSGAGSNMSLACPLKTGIYVMNAIQVPPDTALLKFMYQPNTLYTVQGTVYSLNPKDGVTRHAICHYEVNATIFKTCWWQQLQQQQQQQLQQQQPQLHAAQLIK